MCCIDLQTLAAGEDEAGRCLMPHHRLDLPHERVHTVLVVLSEIAAVNVNL